MMTVGREQSWCVALIGIKKWKSLPNSNFFHWCDDDDLASHMSVDYQYCEWIALLFLLSLSISLWLWRKHLHHDSSWGSNGRDLGLLEKSWGERKWEDVMESCWTNCLASKVAISFLSFSSFRFFLEEDEERIVVVSLFRSSRQNDDHSLCIRKLDRC